MCLITANVGTNKGGAIDIASLKKALRIAEIGAENNLPGISLVESARSQHLTKHKYLIWVVIILKKLHAVQTRRSHYFYRIRKFNCRWCVYSRHERLCYHGKK
ncbi:MAG: hypothetical protein R2807_11145 [Chitinophagales bacterium]